MRRYKVKIEEVRITEFDIDAKNKNNANEIVKEIIFNTNLLNLSCIYHTYEIRLDIKTKRKNNNGKSS